MKAVLILALAAVALAQAPSAGSTFCGHWTSAVNNGSNTGPQQLSLLDTVVSRTILGCSPADGCLFTSVGLLGLPLNARYFNGSSGIARLPNYVTNTAEFAALKTKLINFFAFALGCTVYQVPGTYTPPSLFASHGDLSLNTATFNEFIGDGTKGMTGAIAATGVPLGVATDELSELAYLAALVGTMGYVPGATCAPAQGVNDPCFLSVCSSSTACFAQTGFDQLVNSGTTAWANGLNPLSTTQNVVGLPIGGSVNWRFGSVHNIRQIDSDGGADYTVGGFGATGFTTSHFTYTHKFMTAGTFFFRCEAHVAMHGFVSVGSGVAGLTASLTVLAAAIVAAKALML